MRLEDLMDALLPGDNETNMPSFSEAGLAIEDILCEEKITALTDCLKEVSQDTELFNQDITDIVSQLKKNKKIFIEDFLIGVLEAYFSSKSVLDVLHKDQSPVFPNNRQLADVDYDMLMPVVERWEKNDPA
ncbi:hypothetical protein OAT72_00770 [Alphaproteobacteria bacterium]|nr:hypothetical protein [Alphaproteobacteria bacterium]